MKSLSYYAQVLIGNELWVSNIRFNGLFRINIETGRSVFAGKFPEHRLGEEELHLFAKKYGNKIYFFPKRSETIDIYNLESGDFTYIECKETGINGYVTVIDAFQVDEDRVLIVPCYSQMPLQELSLRKEAIVRSIELKKAYQYVENKTNTMALYACMMEDTIYYPIHGTDKVGSYNFMQEKEEIYPVKGLKKILGDIVCDGNTLWMNADKGIYQWNPYKGILNLICECSSLKEGWIEQFIISDQFIICIPRWLSDIRIIDKYSFKQRNMHIDTSILKINKDMSWRDVRESFVWQNNLVISPVKYKEAVCINLNSNKIEYKEWEAIKVLPEKEEFFMYEKEAEDLQDYMVLLDKSERVFTKGSNNCIGRSILQKQNS